MNENEVVTIRLGDAIYADIDSDEYLRETRQPLSCGIWQMSENKK